MNCSLSKKGSGSFFLANPMPDLLVSCNPVNDLTNMCYCTNFNQLVRERHT